jgi:hypothetical protein
MRIEPGLERSAGAAPRPWIQCLAQLSVVLAVSGFSACQQAPAPPQTQAAVPAAATAPSGSPENPSPSAASASGATAGDSGTHVSSADDDAARRSPRRDREERRLDRRSERAAEAFAAGVMEVAEAQREQLHGRVVEFDATVERLLRDDTRGLPHQRFLVRLQGGSTLLIAHDTALAPHVPLAAGESVHIRGLFEWTPRGGVVHWTHHDPSGAPHAGFIRAGGQTYQ